MMKKRITVTAVCMFVLLGAILIVFFVVRTNNHVFMSQEEMAALEAQTLVQMYIIPETLTPYHADIRFINHTYNRFAAGHYFRLYVRSGNRWRSLLIDPDRVYHGTAPFHNATPANERDYNWLTPELRDIPGIWNSRQISGRTSINFDCYFNGLPPGEYRLIKRLSMNDIPGSPWSPLYGNLRFLDIARPQLRVVAAFTIP